MSMEMAGERHSPEQRGEYIARLREAVEYDYMLCLDRLIGAAEGRVVFPGTDQILIDLLNESVIEETEEGYTMQCLNTSCDRSCVVTASGTITTVEGSVEGKCTTTRYTNVGRVVVSSRNSDTGTRQ